MGNTYRKFKSVEVTIFSFKDNITLTTKWYTIQWLCACRHTLKLNHPLFSSQRCKKCNKLIELYEQVKYVNTLTTWTVNYVNISTIWTMRSMWTIWTFELCEVLLIMESAKLTIRCKSFHFFVFENCAVSFHYNSLTPSSNYRVFILSCRALSRAKTWRHEAIGQSKRRPLH